MNIFKAGIIFLLKRGLLEFLKKFFRYLRSIVGNFVARFFKSEIIHKIQKFSNDNCKKIIDFCFSFYFGFLMPMQDKDEFLELLKEFKELNPKYILEIGTANGGTLFCFCKLTREDAVLISVDLPRGRFGGGYPDWKIPIYQAFAKENQKLYLLREDSHKKETLEKVKQILGGNQLDFLFIDGDHTYEGVKKDFEMYGPLVKKGGLIIFHDITPAGDKEFVGGVPNFWREIKNSYFFREIIKDKNQISYGLGIIYK